MAYERPNRRHLVSIGPSILRLSAWERLTAAAVLIALLWAAVQWAMW
jgi:hypothetical protein